MTYIAYSTVLLEANIDSRICICISYELEEKNLIKLTGDNALGYSYLATNKCGNDLYFPAYEEIYERALVKRDTVIHAHVYVD